MVPSLTLEVSKAVKKYLSRIIVIVAFIGLSVYFLFPTWADSQYQSTLRTLHGADSSKYFDENESSIRDARSKRLKLGLDLQGGMYVTLEVNIGELLDKLAKNKDEKLHTLIDATRTEAAVSDEPLLDIYRRNFEKEGLRMSRYYGDIRSSNENVMSYLREESEKAIDRALEIIRNRIDQYGVSEVSIQRSGNRRIVIELPGVKDEKEVRSLIQETALLEFKLFADPKIAQAAIDNIDKALLGQNVDSLLAIRADTAKADSAKTTAVAADSVKKADSVANAKLTREQQMEKFEKEHPFQSLFKGSQYGIYADAQQKEKINNVLKRADVRRAMGPDVDFAWSAKGRAVFEGDALEYFEFYILRSVSELTGEVVTDARAQLNQQGFGGAIVTMEMNSAGSRDWARVTGENVDKPIAIVLDNAVFSAPRVKQKIIGGHSQIDGMANLDEARLLEIVLKAGALPAPVEIIEERMVGPSLGEDSIAKGVNSFLIGVGLVLIFMVFYYHYAGMTANFAVLFNVWFILGILATFRATLSLPGIAGMLLTVGMAVDANVLINERIREEHGMGKTLRAAIDAGYARAMPAIIDSNITTLITCIILYNLGSGPVQGFALTLMIGLVCSLFSAIVMTRVMIELTLDKYPKLVTFG
jgi:SecD/SecF fusion protein